LLTEIYVYILSLPINFDHNSTSILKVHEDYRILPTMDTTANS